MSIKINLVTDYLGGGLDRAKKEFKQLETAGQKAQFAIRRAAVPATLALGALARGGKSALKAGEAVNSANNRIRQINKSMGLFGKQSDVVTKRLIKLAEAQGRELGISNLTIKATQAKLLTFKNLAKSANVVGGAFDRANKAALDMAAAGFGEATSNAVQLGKALQDPIKGITALRRSGIDFTEAEKEKIKTLVESGKVLEAQELILKAIEKQVGNTAKATADDSKKISEAFAQAGQAIGLSMLPVLEQVTPKLLEFADWARENPQTFKIIAGAIGAIAAATVSLNLAMAVNPYVAAAAGIVAMAVAFDRLYKEAEKFNKLGGLGARILGFVFGGASGRIPSMFKIEDAVRDLFGVKKSPKRGDGFSSLDQIPMMANGGIIKASPGGTLAVIGEGGQDEAVIPLNRLGNMGGNNVTINVNGGDPQSVVDALRTYMFRNGSVPIRISG